ncbi:Carbamate kinase 1 [Raoultella terrigena]|uniref:Carbamate kinase 1 n=1 Tax=Raoultella terrigena TaxID=577 RepID=A0A4U9CUG0_RAOTE|nr:Carbamate kinase 1 [Raoultella terrigena]
MINLAFEAAAKTEAHTPMLPMSVCVALSQGYIGYDLQNALREALLARGMSVPVATVITQVEVDAADEAFRDPSKPIGSFFSAAEAKLLTRQGYTLKEDAGRGYRRGGGLAGARRYYRKRDGEGADGCRTGGNYRRRRRYSGGPRREPPARGERGHR